MADKHPYTSGPGGITQVVMQLRKVFPGTVTAETLKKLGIAPNNESYVLNILKFIGVLDAESKKVSGVAAVFNSHDLGDFQKGFSKLVENAYHELFELHGPAAWSLDINKLISFFRNHDDTSDIVGRRQATTFQTLARIAGKIADEGPAPATPRAAPVAKKGNAPAKKPTSTTVTSEPAPVSSTPHPPAATSGNGAHKDGAMALTVRIEINLPAGGDQSTYDAIFKSIRENLMNGNGA